MRKQTKIAAVVSAAALLAIGASMTSFAATGWQEENGTWVYYDKDGYQVTDTWKKSGDRWFYLNEDGEMAISTLIENGDDNGNYYYVGADGSMVTNAWVELENDDYYESDDDEEPETVWYYFQSSGKAYKTSGSTSFKTINGKQYAFDEDGQMLFGWVGENSDRVTGDTAYATATYYCGESNDGARVSKAWAQLYLDEYVDAKGESNDGEYWFYFQSNGKKYANVTKKINGYNYTFDDNGVMQSEWVEATETTATAIKGYFSDETSGARKKGWFKAVPSEFIDKDNFDDDSAKWFYANSDGTLVANMVKTINSKKYAFKSNGEMMNGVMALKLDADNTILGSAKIDKENYVDNIVDRVNSVGTGANVYYFGGGEDGAMKTGTQTIEIDGDSYQFSFGKTGSEKGIGLNGVSNNVYYVYGKKIKADTDYRYEAVDTDGKKYVGNSAIGLPLVNTSGAVVKSSKVTDAEGRVYTMTDGTVLGKECKVVASWDWK